jgi:hypothetical protein
VERCSSYDLVHRLFSGNRPIKLATVGMDGTHAYVDYCSHRAAPLQVHAQAHARTRTFPLRMVKDEPTDEACEELEEMVSDSSDHSAPPVTPLKRASFSVLRVLAHALDPVTGSVHLQCVRHMRVRRC